MTVYEWLFILFILGTIGITLYKVYNLMRGGKVYDLTIGIILFVGFGVLWFMGLLVLLTNPEVILYMTLFRFGSALFAFNLVFLFAEIFYAIRDRAEKTIEAYSARDTRQGKL